MESKNIWQQIFGRKYLGSKFFRMIFFLGGGGGGGGAAKWGTISFKSKFSWEEIWGGPSFGGEILVRRKFRQQKYFGGIFVSKISL